MMWRGAVAVVAGSLVASASAQVDPLAPLPEPRPTPPPAAGPRPVLVPLTQTPAAPQPLSGFALYKLRLADRARREGVSQRIIDLVLPGLQLNSRVIALDHAQKPTPGRSGGVAPFAPYRRQHVSADLIRRGQARYAANAARLARIEASSGVEASVLMAIYGHETSYGAVTGGFDLPTVLASLAYDGRRRELFESEFVAALKLIDRGYSRWRLKGSYAGATGYPQFMPSTVLRLARDGDGDGVANIWGSELDGLASIAAYLREAGWKPNVHWGLAVRTPPTLNRAAIASRLVAPRCPAVFKRHSQWKSLAEWRALGLVPLGSTAGVPESEQLTLIEPDGPAATAYLLSTNYRAILDYNCSNFYALSVGLLADAIVGR